MLKLYAARPRHTVIGTYVGAPLREPVATQLGEASRVITLHMDLFEASSVDEAFEALKLTHGISWIDIVSLKVSGHRANSIA